MAPRCSQLAHVLKTEAARATIQVFCLHLRQMAGCAAMADHQTILAYRIVLRRSCGANLHAQPLEQTEAPHWIGRRLQLKQLLVSRCRSRHVPVLAGCSEHHRAKPALSDKHCGFKSGGADGKRLNICCSKCRKVRAFERRARDVHRTT